jgi:hypothetical protein
MAKLLLIPHDRDAQEKDWSQESSSVDRHHQPIRVRLQPTVTLGPDGSTSLTLGVEAVGYIFADRKLGS